MARGHTGLDCVLKEMNDVPWDLSEMGFAFTLSSSSVYSNALNDSVH